MFNRETMAKRLIEVEADFQTQIKRSNECLDLCDTDGSERWLREAKHTLEIINNHLKYEDDEEINYKV